MSNQIKNLKPRINKEKVKHFGAFFFFFLLTLAIFSQISVKAKATSDVAFGSGKNLSSAIISPQPSDWMYYESSDDAIAYLGKKSSKFPTVRYQKGGDYLEFSMTGVSSATAVSLETNAKEPNTPTLFYRNIMNGTDANYRITKLPFRVKEEIVLQSKISNLKSKNLTYAFDAQTSAKPVKQQDGSIAFFDAQNNYLFQLDKPFMTDAKGNRSEEASLEIISKDSEGRQADRRSDSEFGNYNFKSIFDGSILKQFSGIFSLFQDSKSKIEPQEYQIILKADADWLSTAAYPVVIDPTITHNADSNFTGQYNRVADSDTTTSTQLESSYPEATLDPYTVLLLHFNEANGTTAGIRDYTSTTRVITANGNASTTSYVTQLGMGNSAAFDGTGDYLTVPDSEDWTWSGDFTVDMWIRFNTISGGSQVIIGHANGTEPNLFRLGWGRIAGNWAINLGGENYIPDSSVVANTWYHIALVRTGSTVKFFKNGIQVGSDISNSTMFNASTNGLNIGADYDNTATLNGYLDDLRILKGRALTPEEIKAAASRRPYSVYTSPVLDASASVAWNTLNWTEGGVNTGNGEQPYNTNSLVAQWDFNDTSGTTLTASSSGSCTTSCNGTLTNFASTASQDQAADTGWTANNKRWGAGALMFDGSNDYVSVPDSTNWDFTGDMTISFWLKPSHLSGNNGFFIQTANGLADSGAHYVYYDTTDGIRWNAKNGSEWITNITLSTGEWTHLSFVRNGSTLLLYKNGKLATTTPTTGIVNGIAAPFVIGDAGNVPNFNGIIDSFSIYNGRALSASEILSNYNAGNIEIQTRTGATSDPNDGTWEAWKPITGETQLLSMDSDAANWHSDIMASTTIATSTETVIKTEGNGSLKVKMGMASTTAGTVALWHFEETGTTTGTTLYDSTSNHNDATTIGTTVVDGIFGKARKFNGTSDYVSVPDSTNWDFTGDMTISFWLNPSNLSSNNGFFIQTANGLADSNAHYAYYDTASGIGIYWNAKNGGWITNVTLSTGEWTYLSFVRNGSALLLYKNGKLATTTSTTGIVNGIAAPFVIGDAGNVPNFNGIIDSFSIYNGRALSADEISETYRMGANHHLTRQVSATDMSLSNKLAFNVAADRPGTYLEAMVGESDHANYELASSTLALSTNTVLYIKGDEIASSTSIKDSSFSGKAITANGNARTSGMGKIGNSVYFDGTGDYLSVPDSADWYFNGDWTVDTFVNFSALPSGSNSEAIISQRVSNSSRFLVRLDNYSLSPIKYHWSIIVDSTEVYTSNDVTPAVGTWHHIAFARSGNNFYGFQDGVSIGTSVNATASTDVAAPLEIGNISSLSGYDFNGYLDELRIIKGTALTPDQIRQAYEYGLRSHQITIDFGASLQPSDLISSATDYNFSITATTSGLSATTSGLYLGDKIIVKENLGGTEYTAQGTVNSINTTTGAITVSSWDTGSTFPAGNGYSPNATVFKWQREYFDLTGAATTTRNAITNLTLRPTNNGGGRTVYLDDFRYNTNYLTASSSSSITSSNGRYLQYRVLFSSWDSFVSPFLSAISAVYSSTANMFGPLIGISGGGFLSF